MNITIRSLSVLFLLSTFHFVSAQIQLFNDEFDDGNTTSNWIDINEEEGWHITQLEEYNIDDYLEGNLYMKPFTVSWYEEYRGAYLFKYVSGNFVITTEVTTTGHDGVSLPDSDYSLAGIMVREPLHYPNNNPATDWQPGQQNYIFMSIGQAVDEGYDFEIKNTCNSTSCLDIVPIDTNTVKIRMARIGQYIIVLNQFPGEPWEVQNRYDREGIQCAMWGTSCSSPFPDTVQIGFVTYTDWPKVSSMTPQFHNSHTIHPDSLGMLDPSPGVPFNPDLIATFDYARFDSLTIPPAFTGLDLSDPVEVTDTDLLSFLGYDTQEHCPDQYPIADNIINTYLTAKAGQNIVAENLISGQSNVTYQAGEEVDLMPGFEVESSSVFQVSIEGCVNE